METLEFKNYGLEEMSHRELQETEGGIIGLTRKIHCKETKLGVKVLFLMC